MIKIINNKNILNFYNYGSQVYGTNTKDSDYDFIVVINDEKDFQKDYYKSGKYEYHIYQKSEFIDLLNKHKINILECYFAPDFAKKKELFKPKLELNKNLLRRSISAVVSNSWIKCKKR